MQGLRVVFVAIDSIISMDEKFGKWRINKELIQSLRYQSRFGYAVVALFSPRMHGLLLEDAAECEEALNYLQLVLKSARCPAFTENIVLDEEHSPENLRSFMALHRVNTEGSMLFGAPEYEALAKALDLAYGTAKDTPKKALSRPSFRQALVQRLQTALHAICL
ncbi:MAG: hypothetical protein WC966_00435 [Bradymonadales bacterium]